MGTTAEKLQAIVDSKEAIKTAISKNGASITDSTPLDEYASKVNSAVANVINSTVTSIENDQVTSVPAYLFANQNITSVNFPNATEVKSYAFNAAHSLTSAYLPSVETINMNAFYGSGITGELKTVLGTEVKSIKNNAFANCSNLTSIDYSTNRPYTAYNDDTYAFGSGAFSGCTGLTSVKYGFEGSFSSTSTCTVLFKSSTFSGCTSLTTAYLRCFNSGVSGLGSNVQLGSNFFNGCINLTSLTLDTAPEGTKSHNKFSLENVNVFNGITGPITVYVPSGKISSYKSMTNWSQLYNDGKVTFVAISE